MASSGDYADSKFNLAAQGERQPGSSFKTMALMTALRNGVNPNSTRYTSVSPTRINDPRFGPILMFGLGGKYVEVFEDVGFAVPPVTASEALGGASAAVIPHSR